MSLILCLETSAFSCSVALSVDGKCVAALNIDEQNSHSKHLTPLIERLLKEQKVGIKDLDAIAISGGPGSYTGLRIGTSVAKGLCYGGELKLIAIGTLKIMAYRMLVNEKPKKHWLFCPALDARRMEVYACVIDQKMKTLVLPDAFIIDKKSFEKHLNKNIILFAGSGSKKIQETIDHSNARFLEDDLAITASDMCVLAQDSFDNQSFEDIAYYTPYYLKPVFITKAKPLKSIGEK